MHFLGFCLTPMGLSWFSNMEFLTECSVMETERIPASQPSGNGGRKGDKQPNNIQIAILCSPGRVQTYCPFRLPTSHLKTNKTKTMNKQNCHHQQRDTDDSRRQPLIFLCHIVRGREWRGGKPSRCYDMEEEFMIMTLRGGLMEQRFVLRFYERVYCVWALPTPTLVCMIYLRVVSRAGTCKTPFPYDG